MKRTRTERIASVSAKRPRIVVDVTPAPNRAAREALIELLLDVLDPVGQSGGRWPS